jgi:Na+-translocating ferredoxin:NAD+ oxidoreductase RnfD subunit
MKNKFLKLFKNPTFYILFGAFLFITFTLDFIFSEVVVHSVLDKGTAFFGAFNGLVLICYGFILKKKK